MGIDDRLYRDVEISPEQIKHRSPKILKRLADSKSGYIRVSKFSAVDRVVLKLLLEEEPPLVELFDSPLGRAYRLRENRQ